MPKYALEARNQYKIDGNQHVFINNVCAGIKKYAGDPKIAERAIKAFLSLTKGRNDWVEGKDIFKVMGIKGYKQNHSYGLWPWLSNGADVLQEQGIWPDMRYRVKNEFYNTLVQVVQVYKF